MNSVLNRLNILSVPIWIRLLGALVLVVGFSLITAIVIGRVQSQSAEQELLEEYVSGEGDERQQDITRHFEETVIAMESFVNNPTFIGQIRVALSLDQGLRAPLAELRDYMDNQLVRTGLFSYVAIINPDGLVVMSNTRVIEGDESVPTFPLGTDLSSTFGYQGGVIAADRGENQRFSVQEVDNATNIFTTTVIRRSGEVVGYVTGLINQEVILNALSDPAPFRNTHSYLITLTDALISGDDYRQQAQASAVHSPVQLAIGGQSGVRTYNVDGTAYIGHYGPITNTPFAIITETSLESGFFNALITRRLLPVAVGMIVIGLVMVALLNQSITPPLRSIQSKINALQDGDFASTVLHTERNDEIGDLARAFVETREQMRLTVEELQVRIDERFRDIEAMGEVSYFAASQRDLQTLMDRVVGLIADKFDNIYHAQIFLLNTELTYSVLRASTGEPGQQLLARGHRLAVGSVSVVGQVTSTGRTVNARDITSSEVHQRNEFLPDTRAEVAIPLLFGDTIIGALDVQSKQSDTFTEDQVKVLEILATQIAVAIENARLYQESTQRLQEINMVNRQAVSRAWTEYMDARRQTRIESHAGTITTTNLDTLRDEAMETGYPAIGDVSDRGTIPVAVPIILREEVLGAVEWEIPVEQFSNDKIQLGQELVTRLAISLDNARLFQESQRATNRERLVNEIATRLSAQTDISQILQTAVREVGQALRAPQVSIQLQPAGNLSSDTNGHHSNEEGVNNDS
ncbi:MAG: GAF domain-containing protein [Aggregatilineales bacterium]